MDLFLGSVPLRGLPSESTQFLRLTPHLPSSTALSEEFLMSATFQETANALANDPDLRAKVLAATTAEDRATILRDAGVPVPTHDDVNSHTDSALAGVAGGGTTSEVAAAAPVAAGAAGAA